MRLEGYRAAIKRAGLAIPQGYEITGDFAFGGGFDAMRRYSLISSDRSGFTGNDAMAVGAYPGAISKQASYSRNMAVIGYDDIELARYMKARRRGDYPSAER